MSSRRSRGLWHSVDALPQLCATEAEVVGLTRPGVPFTILVSDLRTWSLRAYTI